MDRQCSTRAATTKFEQLLNKLGFDFTSREGRVHAAQHSLEVRKWIQRNKNSAFIPLEVLAGLRELTEYDSIEGPAFRVINPLHQEVQ